MEAIGLTVIRNHYGYGLRNDEKPFAHKIPPGGYWYDLPPEDIVVFWNGKIPTKGESSNGLRRMSWDEPARAITSGPMRKLACQLHPGPLLERSEYMEYNVTPQLPDNGLTVAELFAGGGLMAVGLRAAGYNLVWANDFDKNAVKAYRHNLGDHIVHGDITAIDPTDIPDTDVIAGGPPCQDYSVAGTGAGENGERGKLVWAYLRIIEAKRPKAFIFENVKGLITKKHRPTFDALLQRFDEIGYNVSWKLINAWDYGVAQKRERVFIVGIRKDLGFTYEFPEPSPEDYRTKVLRDVIGDLPEPSEYYYVNRQSWKVNNPVQQVFGLDEVAPTIKAQNMPFPPGYKPNLKDAHVRNHNPQPLSEKALEYLHRDPRHLQKHRPPNHDRYTVLAKDGDVIPKIPEGASNRQAAKIEPGIYWSDYIRESRENPARTMIGTGKPKIHPTQPRRFTVRECLRIQSVPDWYVLPDDISLSAQYRIVGNGVASRVAWYLGRALAEQLTKVIRNQHAKEAV